MKKKLIIGICILLIAVLLIPIPMRLKDGGTVRYTAILYTIENVHRLNPDINSDQEYLEGTIIKILGMEVFNSTNDNAAEESTVYSISGEHELFTVTNGVIAINANEEVFDGGDLDVINPEPFTDIASYSVSFYTMTNGEKRVIMSNSVVDQTDGSINISGDLGRMNGKDILIGNKIEDISELRDHLYFELTTTSSDGTQNTYQVQLTVTEALVAK